MKLVFSLECLFFKMYFHNGPKRLWKWNYNRKLEKAVSATCYIFFFHSPLLKSDSRFKRRKAKKNRLRQKQAVIFLSP